jgi:hypothetical protein
VLQTVRGKNCGDAAWTHIVRRTAGRIMAMAGEKSKNSVLFNPLLHPAPDRRHPLHSCTVIKQSQIKNEKVPIDKLLRYLFVTKDEVKQNKNEDFSFL